jgi:hypothetical protein
VLVLQWGRWAAWVVCVCGSRVAVGLGVVGNTQPQPQPKAETETKKRAETKKGNSTVLA